MKAFYGNFLTAVRALCYILANGAEGLRETSMVAVLNANYIKHHLRNHFDLPYDEPVLHRGCLYKQAPNANHQLSVIDIAKRLIDYGFHPPTVAFPLIVSGALMIEPTETEGKEEIDLFIEAMKSIAGEAESNPDLLHHAPHTTRLKRLDEVQAARRPILRWKRE